VFKKLENLPVHSQYIFSLLLFVVKYTDLHTANQESHSINTRYNTNLHLPMANLTAFEGELIFFWNNVI